MTDTLEERFERFWHEQCGCLMKKEEARQWYLKEMTEIGNEYISTLEQEMGYRHWSEEQKEIFALCIKWWKEMCK